MTFSKEEERKKNHSQLGPFTATTLFRFSIKFKLLPEILLYISPLPLAHKSHPSFSKFHRQGPFPDR